MPGSSGGDKVVDAKKIAKFVQSSRMSAIMSRRIQNGHAEESDNAAWHLKLHFRA
jgi:hypothetical protein